MLHLPTLSLSPPLFFSYPEGPNFRYLSLLLLHIPPKMHIQPRGRERGEALLIRSAQDILACGNVTSSCHRLRKPRRGCFRPSYASREFTCSLREQRKARGTREIHHSLGPQFGEIWASEREREEAISARKEQGKERSGRERVLASPC